MNTIQTSSPARTAATTVPAPNGPRKGGKRGRSKYYNTPLSCKVEPGDFAAFLDLVERYGQSRCECLRSLVLRELRNQQESRLSSRPVSHLRRAIEAFELAEADGEIDATEARRILQLLHAFQHEGIFARKARR